MKTLSLKRVYGYPAYSQRIKDYAEKAGACLILDHVRLDEAPADKLKIVVDSPAVLERLGIPVIGYICVNGIYHRAELPSPATLVDNQIKVRPFKWRRIPPKLFNKLMSSTRPDKILAKIDPKSKKASLVRQMFSRFLPANSVIPWTPPPKLNRKKNADSSGSTGSSGPIESTTEASETQDAE